MKAWIYILFFLIAGLSSTSVEGQRSFHVSIDDGLSTNNLTDLYFDSKDNLWIASYNGLMKHEGGRITRYGKRNNDEKYNLSSLEMHSVVEDKCGLIWIATTNAVNILDPSTNIIEKIYLTSSIDSSTFVGYIYWIWQDEEEFIWISTDIGIYKIDHVTHHVEKIKFSQDKSGLPFQLVSYTGGISYKQGLWMMTNGGLTYYEYATKEFHHSKYNPKQFQALKLSDVRSGNQSDLRKDKEGNLWFIHKAKYLAKFNPESNVLDTFKFEVPKGTWQCCMSLEVDHLGNIWIGTRHGGILVFDTSLETFSSFVFDGANSLIQSNYIHSIESNGSDLIFVSSNNGLDIIDYYNNSVKEITLSEESRFINLKYESGDISYNKTEHKVYIPFYGYGFFIFDEQMATLQNEEFPGGTPLVYSDDSTLAISQASGLNPFENRNDKTIKYPLVSKFSNKDKSHIIWYHPIRSDEFIVKRNRGKLYHYVQDSIISIKSIGFKANVCVSKDSASIWYINDQINLSKYDIKKHSTKEFDIQSKLETMRASFSNPRHILDDGEAIWITSQNGILKYNYDIDSLYSYDVSDGLLHGFTFAIVEDLYNDIWVASLGGINKYDRNTNKFQNILPLVETNYMDAFGNAICTDKGILYFHLGNKLYKIDPLFFQSNSQPNKLEFSSIHINDQFYLENDETLASLAPFQNNINIAFSLKDFLYPSLATYDYKLNPGQWISIGNETNLMFNSLKPGRYQLEISATDYNNNQASNHLILSFKINPPFYQTWWFYSLVILSSLSLLFYWYKSKLNVIIQRNKISLQIAELKATAIKAQMNPHFMFNSLNSIQECVMNGETDKAYDYITLFSKFLRSVLNYSDQNNITIQQEMDLIKIYLKLESIRFKEDVQLHEEYGNGIEVDLDLVPALILQPLIENAIWHGLRGKIGNKNIWITFTEKENHIVITVEDDGRGFSDIANKSTHQYESLGLKLVKDRVQSQWVDIKNKEGLFTIESVNNSREYKGAIATLMLPKISNLSKKRS